MFTTFFPEGKTAEGELQHASNSVKIKNLKTMPYITNGYLHTTKNLKTMPYITNGYLHTTKCSKIHGDNMY